MADETLYTATEIVMGQSPSGKTVSAEPRGLPLLNGPTEFGLHHPSPVQFTTDGHKKAEPGDLLFCVRGSTTGRMNWADRMYAIGRGVAAIRHKRDQRLQPFVRAVIEYALPELLSQATGSTFPNVSASQIGSIPYPQFEESEQLAIAHILGTLDDKIELNWRMNENLEAIARAIFKSWFVDFDPVHARIKGRDIGLPKHIADLFPARLVNHECGEIPEGWVDVPLGELASVEGGKQLPTEQCSSSGCYQVFGANGIMGYAQKPTHNGFVIAFGRVGAYCGSVHWTYRGAWINNNASSVVPNRWPEFVLELMLRTDFDGMRTGSAQPFIPNSALTSTTSLLSP